MKEVILNDECAHCKDKECHDGEHFCNQAMKENSFYKNAKLYKGLEVIKRPTYAELEKENAELKKKYDTCLRENTGLKIHSAYVEKKLTKAKELVKKMLYEYQRLCLIKKETLAEAEQFISEVEK